MIQGHSCRNCALYSWMIPRDPPEDDMCCWLGKAVPKRHQYPTWRDFIDALYKENTCPDWIPRNELPETCNRCAHFRRRCPSGVSSDRKWDGHDGGCSGFMSAKIFKELGLDPMHPRRRKVTLDDWVTE